jgi:hypothetical protein
MAIRLGERALPGRFALNRGQGVLLEAPELDRGLVAAPLGLAAEGPKRGAPCP